MESGDFVETPDNPLVIASVDSSAYLSQMSPSRNDNGVQGCQGFEGLSGKIEEEQEDDYKRLMDELHDVPADQSSQRLEEFSSPLQFLGPSEASDLPPMPPPPMPSSPPPPLPLVAPIGCPSEIMQTKFPPSSCHASSGSGADNAYCSPPLFIEPTVPSKTRISSMSPEAVLVSYDLFLSKYSGRDTSRLRKQIDQILSDYTTCNWAEAVQQGTGSPETTLISVYKYIESELQRLDLFSATHYSNKRKKGEPSSVPEAMTDEHWDFVKAHIESMIFEKVATFTKALWRIFKPPIEPLVLSTGSDDDDDDKEDRSESKRRDKRPIQIFFVNEQLEVPQAIGSVNQLLDSALNRVSHLSSERMGGTIIASTETVEPVHNSRDALFLHPLDSPINSPDTDNLASAERTMKPLFEESDEVRIHLELDASHPLSVKLAFLRFATLEVLGVHGGGPKNIGETSLDPAQFLSHLAVRNSTLLGDEEWYAAARGLHTLGQLSTPGEMLQQLKQVVDVITRALSRLLNPVPPLATASDAKQSTSGDDSKIGTTNADETEDASYLKPSEQDRLAPSTDDNEIEYGISIDNPRAENHEIRSQQAQQVVAGDELLPAIIWTLLQANPPQIEQILWLCSSFRHPALLVRRGEEAYCLANLASAVEFLRSSYSASFELPDRHVYDALLLRYTLTLRLMVACKEGDLASAMSLIAQGADLNGLSPDLLDSPLTAAIRFNQPTMLQFLLFGPHSARLLNVNQRVHLYRGPHERCTALHQAVLLGNLHMVVALLNAGANRYLIDEDCNSALDIALEKEEFEKGNNTADKVTEVDLSTKVSDKWWQLQTVLLADPAQCSLLDAIFSSSFNNLNKLFDEQNGSGIRSTASVPPERLVAGLLLQGVSVNTVGLPSCTAVSKFVCIPDIFTPLIAAVLTDNVDVVRMLLSLPVHQCADVNLRNSMGESALLVCVQKCLRAPSLTQLQIAAILLRAGADRYLTDNQGNSALTIVTACRSGCEEELQVRQPNCVTGTGSVAEQEGALWTYNQLLAVQRKHRRSSRRASTTTPRTSALIVDTSSGDRVVDPSFPEAKLRSLSITTASRRSSGHISHLSNPELTTLHEILFLRQGCPKYDENSPGLNSDADLSQSIHSALYDLLHLDPHAQGTTSSKWSKSIYEYAKERNYGAVRASLLQAVDVNASCPQLGYTSLIAAVYTAEIPLIHLLLKAESIDHATCTYSAIWRKIFRAFFRTQEAHRQLAWQGANPTSRVNPYQDVPYDAEADVDYIDRKVRRNRLDLDRAGRGGMTALHYSAQAGYTPIVGLLLMHHATRNFLNAAGHSALDVAVTNGHTDTANVLRYDIHRISICLAAKHGDWTVLQALLWQGVSVNVLKQHVHPQRASVHHELATPLIAAVAHGQREMVQHLLEEVPLMVALPSPPSSTPLSDGSPSTYVYLSYFPQETVDVNLANALGQTALMYAASRGEEALILTLLHRGANRYAKDLADCDAVHWARTQNHQSIASILQHDPQLVFVHELIRQADFAAVVALLKQGVDVNEHRFSLFVPGGILDKYQHINHTLSPDATQIKTAVSLQDVFASVDDSCDEGSSTDEEGGEESHGNEDNDQSGLAEKENRVMHDVNDAELDKDNDGKPVKPEKDTAATLDSAHSPKPTSQLDRQPERNRRFSDANPVSPKPPPLPSSPTPSSITPELPSQVLAVLHSTTRGFIPGETPLIVASRYNCREIISLLLKAPNLQINAVDDNGWSALFHAAFMGHEEVVLLLLKHGANRQLEDCIGHTAISVAKDHKHDIIAAIIATDPYKVHIHDACGQPGQLLAVVALLKQGCPPVYRDERPGMLAQTPLMAAASGGQQEVVRMLLRYPQVHADRDARDLLGRTALMRGAAVGALDVTAVLLNAGCDRTLSDKAGLTARDHASRHSFSIMFQFISQTMVR